MAAPAAQTAPPAPASPSLSAAIGNAFDQAPPIDGAPATPAAPATADTPPGTTPPAPGQPGAPPAAAAPPAGEDLPKVEELFGEAPPAGQAPTDVEPPAGTPKIELALAPETVIGKLDGKDVTAGDLGKSYVPQAAYTQKSQEFADYRRNAEPAVQFVSDPVNVPILNKLGDASDAIANGNVEAGRTLAFEALSEAAKHYGLDLSQPGQAGGKTRDPATGRFSAPTKQGPAIDLEAIKASEGEDSVAYQNAALMLQMQTTLKEQSDFIDSFKTGVQTAHQNAQNVAQVEGVVTRLTEKGVTGIPADAAASLVGKPMTAAQAVQIAGFNQIVSWMVSQRTGRPNEPGPGARPNFDISGKSLKEAIEGRMGSLVPGR